MFRRINVKLEVGYFAVDLLHLTCFILPIVYFADKILKNKIGMLPVGLLHLNRLISFVIPYSLSRYQYLADEWSHDLHSTKIPPNHPINHAHLSTQLNSSPNHNFHLDQPATLFQNKIFLNIIRPSIYLSVCLSICLICDILC